MKLRLILALPLLLAAKPAMATSGIECRSTVSGSLRLLLTIGHGARPALVGASLSEGDLSLTTNGDDAVLAIGQSWIDESHLWLDLIDREATRYEARLRVEFQPRLRGRPATGTLERGGRIYQVRCDEA